MSASQPDAVVDLGPLKTKGKYVLKFGKSGRPHERHLKLSGDQRFLQWESGFFSMKFGKLSSVDICNIVSIETAASSPNFARNMEWYEKGKDRSISIHFIDTDGKEDYLDFICHDEEEFKYVSDAINFVWHLVKDKRSRMSLDELKLERFWLRADTDHSGTLSVEEIISLVSSLNIDISRRVILQIFRDVDIDNNNSLSFDEFVVFMDKVVVRSELLYIWDCLVDKTSLPGALAPFNIENREVRHKGDTLTISEFVEYWNNENGTSISDNEAREMFVQCYGASSASPDAVDVVTFNMWSSLMFSSFNDAMNPSKAVQHHDMTSPLSHYFIASSHNTYLVGDQLTSSSSVQRYVSDLLNGCRCVELDCWDGENGNPIITHGHTLTGKILFKDVIVAIAKYGFESSPYPIILSIENHCCLDQQEKLADIMISILGDKLARPMNPCEDNLPSPVELLGKVLIKGKRGPLTPLNPEEKNDQGEEEEEEEEEDEIEEDEEDEERSKVSDNRKEKLKEINKSQSGHALKGVFQTPSGKVVAKKTHAVKTHPKLSAITYLGTGKVKSFDPDVSKAIPCDMMCSYSEIKTGKLLSKEDSVNGWRAHNRDHLSRIYPKGTRIDSSNYDPAPAWASGSQLVALNYQTGDHAFHVNYGKFRENGNSGYLKKPDYILALPGSTAPTAVEIIVHVIGGHQLPKPGGAQKGEIIDPYVIVDINGGNNDKNTSRTRTINNNGYNPVWNEVFRFTVKQPEIAVLSLEVFDEDVSHDDFIGFASIPVHCIRSGVRSVVIGNEFGKRIGDHAFSSLLVRFTVTPLN